MGNSQSILFPIFFSVLYSLSSPSVIPITLSIGALTIFIIFVSNSQSDVGGREVFYSFIIIILPTTIIFITPVLSLLVSLYLWNVNFRCVSRIFLPPLGGTRRLEWARVHYFFSFMSKAKAGQSWYFSSPRSVRL